MRVLFIPGSQGVLPHLIPLMALSDRLDRTRHHAAFLLPAKFHRALEQRGHEVLDVDYDWDNTFRAEMLAYRRFRPDVVVDDLSLTVLLSATMSRRARVTIRRTGIFPGGEPRNASHRHSLLVGDDGPIGLDRFYTHSEAVCGIPPPKNLAEVCAADMNIVPGIAAVEVLPPQVAEDSSYVFAGPLVIPDSDAAQTSGASHDLDSLQRFFATNQHRRLIYVTLGTILKASEDIRTVIAGLLAAGFAVVSSVALPELPDALREQFHHSRFLPMDTVCSRAQFMIHHCGSGTYQYQIKHGLPALCIGSERYDRDDIAIRLEELGVARYLPAPGEVPDFVERFRLLFTECADPTAAWHQTARKNLQALRAEVDRVADAFCFEDVLERAISRRQQ